ncbi:hypothetical protein HWD99_11095 [Microbacterium sp. C5A9]|uniref:hypothetical protein n=1 Tax=Microbacterium sp. C5A9 TaxID=2736663 RepID=UPI001F519CF7|nr:hypothetical protein [Microbacterium sp. C5A9]MCI1019174.1 hypothetical protein [Microbacterium sp. C5A9]
MSSPNPRGPESAGVSAVLALVLATVGFFALAVFGLGALTVATDTDIIAVPGLGQLPGAAGMLVAVLAFALGLWMALRRAHPSFLSVPGIGVGVGLAHLVAVWVGVVLATGDLVIATAVTGDLVRGGASLVLLLAAAVAAWGGIALRRTRASHPQWPWEKDEDE